MYYTTSFIYVQGSTAALHSPPCDSGGIFFIALRCNSCLCAGCVSIRRRARPCGAVPRHVNVSRPQKLLAHSSSMSQHLGFEDGDSDLQHGRTSSSPGLPRSSELAHSPSLPHLSGTDCRYIFVPSSRLTVLKSR